MEILHEILKEVRDIAVTQATLKEKIESHLYMNKKIEEDVVELKTILPKVERHDVFMKVSVWVYVFLISSIGLKFFSSKFFT